eukprot:436910_1
MAMIGFPSNSNNNNSIKPRDDHFIKSKSLEQVICEKEQVFPATEIMLSSFQDEVGIKLNLASIQQGIKDAINNVIQSGKSRYELTLNAGESKEKQMAIKLKIEYALLKSMEIQIDLFWCYQSIRITKELDDENSGGFFSNWNRGKKNKKTNNKKAIKPSNNQLNNMSIISELLNKCCNGKKQQIQKFQQKFNEECINDNVLMSMDKDQLAQTCKDIIGMKQGQYIVFVNELKKHKSNTDQ